MIVLLLACWRTPTPPNLLVISVDTLRADAVGCWGGPETPFLDALCATGAVFTNHHANAPSTLANHTTLFTGTWAHTHGVARNGFTVHPDNRTLAELLPGWDARGVVGAYPLQARFGLNQGFEVWDDADTHKKEKGTAGSRMGSAVTAAALAQVPADGPFFLFVHYWDPHAPYDPPAPFRPVVPELESAHYKDYKGAARREVQEPLNQLYAGEVRYTDAQIGRLLADLEERGQLEKTVIVITADHGESLGEDGRWGHGSDVTWTMVRTPLLIVAPGIPPGRYDDPVSTVDIAPTILDLLGQPIPPEMEGRSLAPRLRGEALAPRPVYLEASYPGDDSLPWGNAGNCRGVIDGPLKLRRCEGHTLLYDLAADPRESRNVGFAQRQDKDRLADVLEAWDAQADPLGSTDQGEGEVQEMLEALGYTD